MLDVVELFGIAGCKRMRRSENQFRRNLAADIPRRDEGPSFRQRCCSANFSWRETTGGDIHIICVRLRRCLRVDATDFGCQRARLPARQVAAVEAALPHQFTVVRQRSGWNNADLTADILRSLAQRLRAWDPRVQPIVLMDAARLHLHKKVLSTCAREHVWPIIIPPRHTHLLQPLDVDGLAAFDFQLKRDYQHARTMKSRGEISIVDFAKCVGTAFETSLRHRDWNKIFARVGFGRHQQNLKECVRNAIGVSAVNLPAGRYASLS